MVLVLVVLPVLFPPVLPPLGLPGCLPLGQGLPLQLSGQFLEGLFLVTEGTPELVFGLQAPVGAFRVPLSGDADADADVVSGLEKG